MYTGGNPPRMFTTHMNGSDAEPLEVELSEQANQDGNNKKFCHTKLAINISMS